MREEERSEANEGFVEGVFWGSRLKIIAASGGESQLVFGFLQINSTPPMLVLAPQLPKITKAAHSRRSRLALGASGRKRSAG